MTQNRRAPFKSGMAPFKKDYLREQVVLCPKTPSAYNSNAREIRPTAVLEVSR
jgi:hypothetical protein